MRSGWRLVSLINLGTIDCGINHTTIITHWPAFRDTLIIGRLANTENSVFAVSRFPYSWWNLRPLSEFFKCARLRRVSPDRVDR